MGKYGGRVLTVYIDPTGVRVAEGENKNGSPHLSRYFVVHGVEEFFTERLGQPGVYEISNMTGLVDTIVTECRNQGANCRRVMLCSNCFGIETKVSTEGGGVSISSLLAGDVFANIKRFRELRQESAVKVSPDQMACKVKWGDLVEDGVVGTKVTISVGDKFVLKSLVQEFYRHSYDVISIADSVGCLLNLRQSEEATFDSPGKIILDFGTSMNVVSMKMDLPIAIDSYPPMTNAEIMDRIENIIVSCIDSVGRNPKLFLTGQGMSDTLLYNGLIDKLETLGYVVYDMFDRPEVDPETGFVPGTEQLAFTADFTANISMLMSAYAKNVVSILPGVEFQEVFRKNSKAIAAIFLVSSFLLLGASGFLAVNRFLELQDIEAHPPQVSSLQGQISSLQSSIATLDFTIATLTEADVTVLDLINFIEYNQSEWVSVVSMDTSDMLVETTTVDTSATIQPSTEESTEFGGTAGGGGSTRATIIIRGYARTGTAAIQYYRNLFNSGLSVDPVLNGIERYTLPNDEEVFIFEISIGGVN